ncbi:MAG: hypothetical protein H6932_17350 [Burkholderiaceae bacterium]|nr:hypothetical protein [Burkholderiaceae bacterium]
MESASLAAAAATTEASWGRLHVLAQAPAQWEAWVQRLAAVLGEGVGAVAAGRPASPAWRVDLSPLMPSLAGPGVENSLVPADRVRWIIFIDSPARHLALRLCAEPLATASELLVSWRMVANRALDVVHSLRSQCVLFDSDEAAAHPTAVARWLSGWLGEDLPDQAWPVTPPPAGLMSSLAEEYVSSDRRITALWSELQACCSLLPVVPAEPPPGEAQPMAAEHRLVQLQALMASTARVQVLEAAQKGLREELDAAQQHVLALESMRLQDAQTLQELGGHFSGDLARARAELKAANERLSSTQQDLDIHKRRADEAQGALTVQIERARGTELQAQEARAEAEQLLFQLQLVQEALESHFLQLQDARNALSAAQTEAKAVQADLAAANQQLQRERKRGAESRIQLEQHRRERAALAQRARELKDAADLLLVHMHHVPAELETHVLALQSAQRDMLMEVSDVAALSGGLASPGLREWASRNEITVASEKRPYCELTLSLLHLRAGTTEPRRTSVRLVEHHGRAGLALVAAPDSPPPISQWAADGVDARGPYMLFVPTDATGRLRISQLGTRNWQTLRMLAGSVLQAVTFGQLTNQTYWQAVAARLVVALDALQPRLRYDNMRVQQERDSIRVQLDGVSFGNRALPPVALRWSPNDRKVPLLCLRTDERQPCLAAWPVGNDGVLALEWPLPVGNDLPFLSRLRWWYQALPADRDVALALVDSLLAVPSLLPAQASVHQRDKLVAGALRLRRALLRTLRLGQWAARLRNALPRKRLKTSAPPSR